MAEYEMQESNLPNEEGKRILFPRMVINTQRDLEDIAKAISQTSTFSPGDIKGLIIALADEIAYRMGEGCSVKIDCHRRRLSETKLRVYIHRQN